MVPAPEPEGPFLPSLSLELRSSDFLGLSVDTRPLPRGWPALEGRLRGAGPDLRDSPPQLL